MIRVLSPGLLTSVQDLGRPGYTRIGVGAAGAMDAVAQRLANILVGNVDNAAALEITLRGPRLRFERDSVIALTGAPIEARCGGERLPSWQPVAIRAGSEVDCAGMRCGARSYLAVAGGIAVDPVLGSRSTDINAALGPLQGRALIAGDVLPVAQPASPNWSGFAHAALDPPGLDPLRLLRSNRGDGPGVIPANWSIDPAPWFDADTPLPYALIRGAHFDRLDEASQRALFEGEFRVAAESNRVGYRLQGTRLTLREPLELISAAVTPGTVQLPPGGDPIMLMAEAPATGGYPRIAHVEAVDLSRLAQRRPGERIRFVETSLADAQTRYLERERALAVLVRNIRDRLR